MYKYSLFSLINLYVNDIYISKAMYLVCIKFKSKIDYFLINNIINNISRAHK